MPNVKIAIIGAGSYVFGPGVLAGVCRDHRLAGVHVALMDVDADAAELMAGLGRRLAKDAGIDTELSVHTDREPALDGADYVINAAAPQLHRRFAEDVAIVDRLMPGHVVTEFGGVAGLSYSLRQVAFIREVCQDIRRLCPGARLLNAANPLPRVCAAAEALGVRTAGFCNVSIAAYGFVSRVLGGPDELYPFTACREVYELTIAGTNHFTWIVGLRDRATGEDLMDDVRRGAADRFWPAGAEAHKIFRRTGCLLAVHDGHTQDFRPPTPGYRGREKTWHGSDEQRRLRREAIAAVAAGGGDVDELLEQVSWEKPIDLVAGVSFGREVDMHPLNLPNRGQLPDLPEGAIVETPADVDADGVHPRTCELPAPAAEMCRGAAEVTETIVRAGLDRDRSLVHRAVELDPTILDKPTGRKALDACLAAHADVIGEFA